MLSYIYMANHTSGKNHHNWKGGRSLSKDGYVLILSPKHPHASVGGRYVMEHRLVMEKHIGRYLESNEIVHHLNEDKADNRLENLILMSRSEHVTHHTPRRIQFGCNVEGCEKKHWARGYCHKHSKEFIYGFNQNRKPRTEEQKQKRRERRQSLKEQGYSSKEISRLC